MASKVYTAQEMREIEQLINLNSSDEDCLFICNYTKDKWEMENIFDYNEEATLKVKAMLRQAADMRERIGELLITYRSCPAERDMLNYILRGDAGKEER